MKVLTLAGIVILTLTEIYNTGQAYSQTSHTSTAMNSSSTPGKNYILLTIFLKHDQSKNIDQIEKELKESGFYQKFPPEGIEIESWKVVMGIGQVVTLKVPPDRLREVNLSIEKMAWGAFRTEFYITYDFLPVYRTFHENK